MQIQPCVPSAGRRLMSQEISIKSTKAKPWSQSRAHVKNHTAQRALGWGIKSETLTPSNACSMQRLWGRLRVWGSRVPWSAPPFCSPQTDELQPGRADGRRRWRLLLLHNREAPRSCRSPAHASPGPLGGHGCGVPPVPTAWVQMGSKAQSPTPGGSV